jgi:hypothetical protein
MRNIVYIGWAVWAIACAALKIAGAIGWWCATSCVWFPLGVLLCAGLLVYLIADISYAAKRKAESKIPDSCANCLFGKTRKFSEDEKCLGVRMVEGHEYGSLCSYYRRHLGE